MKRALPFVAGFAVLGAVLIAAFYSPPKPVVRSSPAHYAEFPRLVRAAWTGDRPLASVVARDLTAGPAGEQDGEATLAAQDQLGGAIGFVGFTEDAAELADAVAIAGSACGACHTALDVIPPARPAWAHESAGEWLAWGLVWGDSKAPAGGESNLKAVERVFEDVGADVSLVTRAWLVCEGCHSTTTQLPD